MNPNVTIRSPKRQYTLVGSLGTGDASDVYLATAGGHDYVVKVSRGEGGAALLDNERQAVHELLTRAGDTHYARYIPALAESSPLEGDPHRRVNVFTYRPGFYSLEQVRARYPGGLDGRHLAWIFKRLLTAVGFAHRSGWVHGAVLPPHALLQAEEHGLLLVGWTHAVRHGETVTTVPADYRDWYPPEVQQEKPAGPPADVFVAAKCVVYLAGGDPVSGSLPESVPAEMERFFRACLLEGPRMRPGDAWNLLEDFDELLYELYGPPTFHHLTMP